MRKINRIRQRTGNGSGKCHGKRMGHERWNRNKSKNSHGARDTQEWE